MSNETSNLQQFTYFAFISYSRSDEKWASWLQKKLETYRLPSVLQKQNNELPARTQPIFRDKTDLATGTVKGALFKELQESKYLIVICSPNSAKSKYVDFEISSFMELGRAENIIPLIVGGEVGASDPDNECFPPSLHSGTETLLGISILQDKKRDALIKIVASLLGLRFDELKMRDKQRQRKRRTLFGTVAALFLAVASVTGYFLWDYYVPKEAHFADYVLRYGEPEGLYPLTDKQVAERETHYTIISKEHKVRTLIHNNSAGQPVPHKEYHDSERPMIAQYYYVDNTLSRVEYLDHNGKILLSHLYTPNLLAVDFVHPNDSSTAQVIPASTIDGGSLFSYAMPPWALRSDIARHKLKYDDNGFITEVMYMRDNRGMQTSDTNGIYGMRYELDSLGRVLTVTNLDINSEPLPATPILARTRYTYSLEGNVTKIERIDDNDLPVLCSDGWMVVAQEYDDNNNLTEVRFLDEAGDLTMNWLQHASICRMGYDERGNRSELSHHDMEGNLIDDGINFARRLAEWDENGFCIWEGRYYADGAPAYDSGFAFCSRVFDERGNILEELNTDENGVPFSSYGTAVRTVWTYDERGNEIDYATYDATGNLTLNGGLFARAEVFYDERDNITEVLLYGEDSAPIHHDVGYAKMTYKYDDRDNLIEIRLYNEHDELFSGVDNAAIIRMKYNANGNEIELAHFDADGKPVDTIFGYSKATREYDTNGNIIELAYFHADGSPAECEEGYARETKLYDEQNNAVEGRHFDANGEPAPDYFGIVYWTYEYDDTGSLCGSLHYDENGGLRSRRIYSRTMEHEALMYDEFGKLFVRGYYDVFGDLTTGPEGVAMYIYEYNDEGVHTLTTHYDTLMMETEDFNGVAVLQYFYTDSGLPEAVACYSADRKPTHNTRGVFLTGYIYDERENLNMIFYYNKDIEPVVTSEGYAAVAMEYDEANILNRITYLDMENEPTRTDYGFAIALAQPDTGGEITGYTACDEQENPIAGLGLLMPVYGDHYEITGWKALK